MKHKEIKSFKDFPDKLKFLIIGHFVFVPLLFLFLYSMLPALIIIYLIICALLLWLAMGLVTLKEVYRRWEKRIFSYISVLSALGLIVNLFILGPILNYLWFFLILFVSLGIVYYLSSNEILDIYYHPTKKSQIIAWRDV